MGDDAAVKSSVQENDKNVLDFMDSMDNYLVLMNSLSSLLRQGWFELASARHSMGASRISSALFDLKSHSAATTLQLNNHPDAGAELEKLNFSLCKWGMSESPKGFSEEANLEDKQLQRKSDSPKLLNKDGSPNSKVQEKIAEARESPRAESPSAESPRTVEDQARKERLKSLSMFGMLVSPKLRAAQSSFETALETIVEVANKRAELLKAYDQVREKMDATSK